MSQQPSHHSLATCHPIIHWPPAIPSFIGHHPPPHSLATSHPLIHWPPGLHLTRAAPACPRCLATCCRATPRSTGQPSSRCCRYGARVLRCTHCYCLATAGLLLPALTLLLLLLLLAPTLVTAICIYVLFCVLCIPPPLSLPPLCLPPLCLPFCF